MNLLAGLPRTDVPSGLSLSSALRKSLAVNRDLARARQDILVMS